VTLKVTRDDLELLQGTWAVTGLEVDGQQMPESMLGDARIEVKGDRFTTTGMGSTYEGTLCVNASVTPAQLDMSFNAGPEIGAINRGIYQLDGNTWTICLATRGELRPSRFATSPGTGFALETLTRTAVGVRERRTSHESVGQGAPLHATEFDGEWKMVSGITDGVPMDGFAARWVTRTSVGNDMQVHAGPKLMMRATFTVDPSQTPKAIDYFFSAGPNQGKSQLAIYEFEGDLLRVCASAPGTPRPTAFESIPGQNWTFTVWKRKR
jgi:uncharacterized protein (TIGR03067 family)